MMIVYFFALPLACFAIGVVCGRRSVTYAEDIAHEYDSIVDADEITHVEYTHDQMGYDK